MKTFKHLWTKMKWAFFACALLVSQNYVQAQPTLQLPSHPDNHWYSVNGLAWALNTAAIADNGSALLCSMATYSTGSIGQSVIKVTDYATGLSAPIVTGINTLTGSNDIIIGNSNGTGGLNSSTDYILATCNTDMAGDPVINFYDVNISPLITINMLSTYVISPGTYLPTAVHMDIIANYGSSLGGFAPCYNFMITWDDQNTGNIYVAEGDLNAMAVSHASLGTIQYVDAGTKPDVAGIQRGASASSLDDVALITYMGSGGLYYKTWDATAGIFSHTVQLDNTTGFPPRIDAFDNYRVNNTLGVSHYKIVSCVYNAGSFEVRTYDDLLPTYPSTGYYYAISSMNSLVSAGYPAPPYDFFAPCVSTWGNNGYAVQQVDQYSANADVLIAQPVDYSNPYGLLYNSYYWVNSASGTPYNAAGADYFNSVSSTPNMLDGTPELFAWAEQPAPGIWDIKYKTTATTPPAFKPGTTAVACLSNNTKVQLYPNPATDDITIKTDANAAATNYIITDLLGRTVLNGNISASPQHIGISSLTSGGYIIKITNGSNAVATIPFVKN